MRTSVGTLPRLLALVAQFITFCGFVVITAGLATLQKTTNKLGPVDRIPVATASLYIETYQNALITPYPADHHFQFAYIWFIIFFQFVLLLLTLAVTLVPGFLNAGKSVALTLLAIATTLTITVVNNLTFFHKSTFANTAYGHKDINCTFAGSLIVVLGNFFTIFSLGIWTPVVTTNTAYPATTTAKREADVPAV